MAAQWSRCAHPAPAACTARATFRATTLRCARPAQLHATADQQLTREPLPNAPPGVPHWLGTTPGRLPRVAAPTPRTPGAPAGLTHCSDQPPPAPSPDRRMPPD